VSVLTATGWVAGRHTVARPAPAWERVHRLGQLTVWRSHSEPAGYILDDGRSLLIDPPRGTLDDAQPGAKVEAVVLTHHHRDSVAGAGEWIERKVPVRAAKVSAEWMTPANVTKFWRESVPLRNSRTAYFVHPTGIDGIDCSLADGQTFEFAGHTVKVVATPGHSRDHLAFAVKPKWGGRPLVFCGDAVTGDGKLWTPFTTDWDHWTDAGLTPAADSLRKLAKLNPAVLFPAHGPVVTDPAALLTRAADAVVEVAALKSFERFTDRLGDAPKYDFLVPAEQVGSGGDKPWARVSDHLWLTGNTYVLVSGQGRACLVLDPWGKRSVEQIARLRAAENLGPVERVVFSHAHYDHFDGVYDLPGRDGYKVWALDTVADPLADPFKYRAPFLDERPIRFDQTAKAGESLRWREYTLRFHHLPGQTWFTAGIETTIDGQRCLFTADNFFHQRQYSGSGGWMGLNRSTPAMYAASARTVLAVSPDWVLAEHGGPYKFDAEDFRRRVRWADAATAAANAVCPSGMLEQDWNPHRVRVEPVRVAARPGATVRCKLVIANALDKPDRVSGEIRWPWGRPTVFDERFAAAGRVERPLEMLVPADAEPGRHVIPITAHGSIGGEVADPCLVLDVRSD
jgi:glyoxylase-like metal-dependent hydrolase (beta-lactamase superfamily II)